MKYLVYVMLLLFVGCAEETQQKNSEFAEAFAKMMSETPEQVNQMSIGIKTNTEVLLDIKNNVDKLVEKENKENKEDIGKQVSKESFDCNCEVTGICNCVDCQCENCSLNCEDGVCPLPQKESPNKDVVKSNQEYIWGSRPDDYFIIKYSESWCRGCKTWDSTQKPQILSGVRITERIASEWPDENIEYLPTFKLFVWDGLKWNIVTTFVSSGQIVSAATINTKINSEIQKRSQKVSGQLRQYGDKLYSQTQAIPTSSNSFISTDINELRQSPIRSQYGRLSASQIRSFILSNYNSRTATRYADVAPRSNVWNHLQSAEHGFSREQVSGLSQWMALALHSASHVGQITPFG